MGANGGLGASISKSFVANGWSVFLLARNKKKLELLKNQLDQLRTNTQIIEIYQVDVKQQTQVDKALDFFIERYGPPLRLVNNVGENGPLGKLENVTWGDWVEGFSTNIFSFVYFMQRVIPLMKAQNYGRIVTLSGGGATAPLPYISSYAASKAALIRLVETLALEVKDYDIQINAVAPGVMKSSITEEYLSHDSILPKEFTKKIREAFNQSDEIIKKATDLIFYLCTQQKNFISGKLISSLWDPWPFEEGFITHINQSDTYTLRRLTNI